MPQFDLSDMLASIADLPWRDAVALAVFALAWLVYEPILRRVGRASGVINRDMEVVRAGWMRTMVSRKETRLLDANLMGHALNSASFFASANLILIAGLAGALFGGDRAWRGVRSLDLVTDAPAWLFQLKLALVLATLVRGLLEFIWSIRQMNYWLAAVGAVPEGPEPPVAEAWSAALAQIINPALTSFAAGVRAYYFALAAAIWLLGPVLFMAATVAALGLLIWLQLASRSARGVRRIRQLLEGAAV